MAKDGGLAGTSVPAKPSGLGRLFMRKSVEQMHAEHARGELKKIARRR